MRFNYRLFFEHYIRGLRAPRNSPMRRTAKRIKALVVFTFIYVYEQVLLRFFSLLDEVFFPAYRRQSVKKPTFIIGNFRSGTTLLQRLLAEDRRNFTAMQTWEIYVAPTISQRKLFRGILLAERIVGSPIRRFLDLVQHRVLDRIDFHRVGLREPEEDVGLLLYLWDGLFVWFFFPVHPDELVYPYFDQRASAPTKRRIMRFYRLMVQRHLYYHATRSRRGAPEPSFLAKNPAFSPMVRTLLSEFPDARFVYMARHPAEMAPSEINWFSYCFHYFGSPLEPFPYVDEILDMCAHWYDYPPTVLDELPPARRFYARFSEVIRDLSGLVQRVYSAFGLRLDSSFRLELEAEVVRSRAFVPKKKRSLAEVGLDRDELCRRFAGAISRFGLEDSAMVPAGSASRGDEVAGRGATVDEKLD